MNLITNPYSLFRKLIPEIEDRFSRGVLPEGKCSIRFDQSKKYPGGAIIETKINPINVKVSIISEEKDFQSKEKQIENKIEFNNLTQMTLFFSAYIPSEELDDDEIIEESGAKVTGNGKQWLIGLFEKVQNAMHELDHY
jgi:hypothetical protein